jgi:hypothetical protein
MSKSWKCPTCGIEGIAVGDDWKCVKCLERERMNKYNNKEEIIEAFRLEMNKFVRSCEHKNATLYHFNFGRSTDGSTVISVKCHDCDSVLSYEIPDEALFAFAKQFPYTIKDYE